MKWWIFRKTNVKGFFSSFEKTNNFSPHYFCLMFFCLFIRSSSKTTLHFPSFSHLPISPVRKSLKRTLNVHAVSDPTHTQIQEVLFCQRWQVGSINLVVEKTFPVLCQIQVSQPISNIIFAPVGEGLRHKWLIGWRRC